MKKLSIVKLGNAVQIRTDTGGGQRNETVFKAPEFLITEEDNFKIKITHVKSGQSRFTSYFNAVWWDELEEKKAGKDSAAAGEDKGAVTDGSGAGGKNRGRGAKV